MQDTLPILSFLPTAAFTQPNRSNHPLKRRLLPGWGQPQDLT